MEREVPRRRRRVSPVAVALLAPIFRYSSTRDAYILRGIGGRLGPVLVPDRRTNHPRGTR
jgi:hypothetical protein